MFDPETGITLLIPVPDFKQMADATGDDLLADAWVSPKAVELKLPVAIANIRRKQATGVQIVTSERTTDSKYVVPRPSLFQRYQKVFPLFLTLLSNNI